MNLHGKIKSLYEIKKDVRGELVMTKETKFANSGMVKSTDYIYAFNNVSDKSINHYDYKNRLVKQDFLTNGSLITYQEYLHINPFKDSVLIFDSNGDLLNKGIYTYTGDRQIDVIKINNAEGLLVYYDTSTYDNKGRLIKTYVEQEFDPETKMEYQYSYKYDSLGRIQVLSTYDSYNDTLTVENYKYKVDEMNNWIEKQIFSVKGDSIAIITRTIEYK